MNQILQVVKGQHASENTKVHCLYGFYYQGLTKARLARLYGKSESVIKDWITKFEETGGVSRKRKAPGSGDRSMKSKDSGCTIFTFNILFYILTKPKNAFKLILIIQ
jgi:hypothetical protein